MEIVRDMRKYDVDKEHHITIGGYDITLVKTRKEIACSEYNGHCGRKKIGYEKLAEVTKRLGKPFKIWSYHISNTNNELNWYLHIWSKHDCNVYHANSNSHLENMILIVWKDQDSGQKCPWEKIGETRGWVWDTPLGDEIRIANEKYAREKKEYQEWLNNLGIVKKEGKLFANIPPEDKRHLWDNDIIKIRGKRYRVNSYYIPSAPDLTEIIPC